MRSQLSTSLAVLMGVVTAMQPVLATDGSAAPPRPSVCDAAPDLPGAEPGPASSPGPSDIEAGRERIAAQLVELGRAEPQAADAAGRLTAEDLEVLLANPQMMQAAGAGEAFFLGILMIAGLITLAILADSSVIIVSG